MFYMKASIVSLYGCFNYGNRLQSFAAQEILRKLGFETEVVYIQTDVDYLYQRFLCKIIGTRVYDFVQRNQSRKLYHKKFKAYVEFNRNYIKTNRYKNIEMIQDCDADYFVVGSDQVWKPKYYNDTLKQLFFLTFAKPEKKICLSPSFGVYDIPDKWKPYFTEQLNTFPRLSVREVAGAKIIKDLTGREAEVLIDPTLMLDREEWRDIAKAPNKVKTDCPYILTYFIGRRPKKAIAELDSLSKMIKGEVYHLLDKNMPDLFVSGPSEFLYLIDHASLVLTDSFHACIFSFLFGKPFLAYKREGNDNDMLSRLESFFDTFNLKNRFADEKDNNNFLECNYQEGYIILERERQKLLKFLQDSFSTFKK